MKAGFLVVHVGRLGGGDEALPRLCPRHIHMRPVMPVAGPPSRLQQIAKLLGSETGVPHDAAKRKCVDGVMSRDRQDTHAV